MTASLVLSLGKGRNVQLHSDHKLVWFYRLGGLALLAAAIGLTIQAVVSDEPKDADKPDDRPVVVNLDMGTLTNPSPTPRPTASPAP